MELEAGYLPKVRKGGRGLFGRIGIWLKLRLGGFWVKYTIRTRNFARIPKVGPEGVSTSLSTGTVVGSASTVAFIFSG